MCFPDITHSWALLHFFLLPLSLFGWFLLMLRCPSSLFSPLSLLISLVISLWPEIQISVQSHPNGYFQPRFLSWTPDVYPQGLHDISTLMSNRNLEISISKNKLPVFPPSIVISIDGSFIPAASQVKLWSPLWFSFLWHPIFSPAGDFSFSFRSCLEPNPCGQSSLPSPCAEPPSPLCRLLE